MRVRPVAATGSTRYTKRDMTVGGHFVPKGSMVDVPFYAVSLTANLSSGSSDAVILDQRLHTHLLHQVWHSSGRALCAQGFHVQSAILYGAPQR